MKIAKKFILLGLISSLSFSSSSLASASTQSSSNLLSDKTQIQVLSKSNEVKDVNKLFNLAKQDSNKSSKPKLDQNGRRVYRITQALEKSVTRSGNQVEKFAVTQFNNADAPTKLTRSSKNDGEWDSTYSAYLYSTIYYSRTSYNGQSCYSISSISGGVSTNSGVSIHDQRVAFGQIFGAWGDTHRQNETHYDIGSFSYSAPDWVPVPVTAPNGYGNQVACTVAANLQRGGSIWYSSFVNSIL